MKFDTSKSLLGRISQSQNEDAWRFFVSLYAPFIRSCLTQKNVPNSDRDDLCQDTLTQVFKGISQFNHNGRPGAFRQWLKTIVTRNVWNYFQSKSNKNASPQEIDITSIPNDNDDLVDQWEREHDRYVINKMLSLVKTEFAPSSWHAFRLVSLEGQSPEKAGRQLGMTINAVVIAKSRVLRRLRILGEGLVTAFDVPDGDHAK